MDDEWRRRQQDIDEAQRRGELFADVRTLTRDMNGLRESVKDIQMTVNGMAKELVSRKDFDIIKTQVEGFRVWQKVILALAAIVVFLSQVLPRVWGVFKP